jgi:hypothetical protein
MNSISGMLPKCWVERSSFCHNNTSSTFVWANGSLDLYPSSRHPSMRTCSILYLILNQYYQKPSLIPWSIKSICSITFHRPLWEHLVNKSADRGTHLSNTSSTTLQTVVDITRTIPHLCEMRKSCSLFVYETMCVLVIWCMFVRQCGWYIVCLWDNVDDMVCVWDNVDDNVYVVMDEFAIYMCLIFCVATRGGSKLGITFGCCFP